MRSVEGILVADKAKVNNLDGRQQRLRLMTVDRKVLLPELLGAIEISCDGDNRRYLGFELFLVTNMSNPKYMLQIWDVVVLDAMATVKVPKPEWPKVVEFYHYVYQDDDGLLSRTREPITEAEAKKLFRARRLEESRVVRQFEKNGDCEEIEAPWMKGVSRD